MSHSREDKMIKVSVGVLVYKDGKGLLGLKKDHNKLTYVLPAGHLEYMESFKECAKREVMEECGIQIKNIELQFISNTDSFRSKHYIHIGLKAKWADGELKTEESEGLLEWDWYSIDRFPENLSKGAMATMRAFKEGRFMYDLD